MQRLLLLASVCCVPFPLVGSATACDKASNTQRGARIEIGQQMADVKEALRDRHIDYENSGLAVALRDEDEGLFSFPLEEGRTYVSVIFSKSRGSITRLTVVMGIGNGKKYQVDMAAKSIALEDDRSYIVHFLPTAKGK